MPLIDEVIDRVPEDKLAQLTNPNERGATTTDTVYLQLFVDDVEADFESMGVGEFDPTDARHVSAGIIGVILKIQVAKLDNVAVDKHEKWLRFLEDKLRLVTNNDRINPKSSSELTTAEEAPGGIIVAPWFDKELVGLDMIPDLLGGSRHSDNST